MKNDAILFYNTLKEIYFCLDNGDRQLFEAYQLTVPRFYALRNISENPGLSMTELSTLMLSDKSNITRLVKSIEEEGLVCRKQGLRDKRKQRLYLSEKGEHILKQATTAHNRLIQARFSDFSDKDKDLLRRLGVIKQRLESALIK